MPCPARLLFAGGTVTALLIAGLLAAAAPPAAAAAAAAPSQAAPSQAAPSQAAYYLALGDSLSQGVQPATPPLPPGVKLGQSTDTAAGYADDLAAHYGPGFGGALRLVKLGCSGETTTSMLTGAGSHCAYPQGSQLAAALAFIAAHPHQVRLITIDIGANDIDGCATASSVSVSCFLSGIAAMQRDLPRILGALRQAAGWHTVIAGMTLYDPVLAAYLTGPAGQAVAWASVPLAQAFNALLTVNDMFFGVETANVQDAFSTSDFTDTATVPGVGTVPLNVARMCQWTWLCAPAPFGPNVHPDKAGYREIASAFEQAIGPLR